MTRGFYNGFTYGITPVHGSGSVICIDIAPE